MTRRALCIGINDYPGTGSDLSGCVNDARDWASELYSRGFEVDSLIDAQATRAAMTSAIHTLISSAQRGDTVVFTYSGHGTWVVDQDGDEVDGRDEALCPHDISTDNALLDDEIRLRANLIAALRRVLERGELRIEYQPQLALRSGRYVGAEATDDDDEAFNDKMERLTAQLAEQMAKGAELDAVIREKLGGLGYAV